MKSIEQKAQAYDKALEIIIDYYQKIKYSSLSNASTDREVLEKAFPQLKEGEDERIRNFISNELACLRAADEKGTIRYNELTEAIAWLEKQGEQKSADIDNKFLRIRETKPANIVEFLDRLTTVEQEFLWEHIEKVKKIDRKERKQKPADKVEPKFKVGDWIVKNNDSHINIDYSCCKITKVENENYTIESIYGYKGYNTLDTFERDYHLWTLADAKDGDILCTYECNEPKIVFILKGTPKKHYALGYHCYYNIMYPHFESDSEKGCLAPNDEDIKPATKEQHDLLFQKMKEAGYKWDAEKKELKKIGQNHAWSEEDEENFKWFEKFFRAESVIAEGRDIPQDKYMWFKNLKDRVQLQPKQEWSEEDRQMRMKVLKYLSTRCNVFEYEEVENWLQSLRPQNRWKPTEEQLIDFETAINDFIPSSYKEMRLSMENLLGQLKAL